MRLNWISSQHLVNEAQVKWAGPLHNFLGTGQANTVNYGTGEIGRSPLLYIPVSISLVRSHLNAIRKRAIIWFDNEQRRGEVIMTAGGGERDKIYQDVKARTKNRDVTVLKHPRIEHVGEAHITIVQDFFKSDPPSDDLTDALDAIAEREGIDALDEREKHMRALMSVNIGGEPLFDENGMGMPVHVDFAKNYTIWRSFGYRDEFDPQGPIQISLEVNVAEFVAIRNALGLPDSASIPGTGVKWIPHVGIGFISNMSIVSQSYLDKHPEKRRPVAAAPLASLSY